MKRGETYSGGWLKAQDLLDQGKADGIAVTIKGIRTSEMDDGKVQRAISFNETDQELGLNVTNWDAIAAITGEDDDDNWVGQRIVVYPHKLDRPFNGKTHGIRVRAVTANGQRAAMPSTAPTEAAWSWDMAVMRAGAVGVDRPTLIKLLKEAGKAGWNPERDTGFVKQLIADQQGGNAAAPPFGDEQVFKEEEIPF
jgi:hypothetical protein